MLFRIRLFLRWSGWYINLATFSLTHNGDTALLYKNYIDLQVAAVINPYMMIQQLCLGMHDLSLRLDTPYIFSLQFICYQLDGKKYLDVAVMISE